MRYLGIVLLCFSLIGANAFATQVDGRFIKDGSITATKLGTGAVTSINIGNNSVGAAKIRLENNSYLRSLNFAGNGDVNVIKVGTDDRLLFDSFPHTPSTTPTDDYDVVNKKYVDDNITSLTWLHEILYLNATDISNQYKDSTEDCTLGSVTVSVLGLKGSIGQDYTLSSVGGNTRVSFTATTGFGTGSQQALLPTDAIDFQCQY